MAMKFRDVLMVGGAALALIACGDDDDQGAEETHDQCASGVTYALVARPFLEKYCLGCHSQSVVGNDARVGAPDDANFDTEAEVMEHGGHIYENLIDRMMPPADAPAGQPTSAERDAMLTWLECSGASEHEHED